MIASDLKRWAKNMSDPISLVIAGAVAGGAAGEVVKMSIQSGQLWLRDRFANHKEKVVEVASSNANNFLNKLAEKVNKLEEEHTINRSIVDSVLEDPSYSLLLQKSILSAAEQSSDTKHELLSRIVSERIRHNGDDMYALCAPIAVEAIARCTRDHLKMLALLSYIFCLHHNGDYTEEVRAKIFLTKVAPFCDLTMKELDALHLQSIALLSYERMVSYRPDVFVDRKFDGEVKTWDSIPKYGDINPFLKTWNNVLIHCSPSSVGQLVGFTVFDQIHGKKSDLSSWGK
jgi:hypothetical protein